MKKWKYKTWYRILDKNTIIEVERDSILGVYHVIRKTGLAPSQQKILKTVKSRTEAFKWLKKVM